MSVSYQDPGAGLLDELARCYVRAAIDELLAAPVDNADQPNEKTVPDNSKPKEKRAST